MPDTTTTTSWRSAYLAPRIASVMRLTGWERALRSPRLLVILGFMLATAVIYAPSSVALFGYWTDTVDHTYTHGFLILLTSVWLLARDRAQLDRVALQPEPLALALLVLASAVWVFFWGAAIQDPHLLMLPILALIAVRGALGRQAARIAAFPLLFLGFAMPVWSDLVDPLQQLSAKAVGALIWLTGLPAYMAGNIIVLPAGSLEIAEGCSGMHFLIVGVAMATLYGEVVRDSVRRRIAWIALMGGFALIANWLRIFVVAIAAYATDMRTFLVLHHYWFGWGMFAAFFAGFLWITGRFPPATLDRDSSPAADSAGRVSATHVLATLACLAVLPLGAYAMQSQRHVADPGIAIDWPVTPAGWRVEPGDAHIQAPGGAAPTDWNPAFAHPTARARRRYLDSKGYSVDVLAVAYRSQRQGAKLVAYGNSLLGPKGEEEGSDRVRLRLAHQCDVRSPAGEWREMTVLDRTGARALIWSRYRIGDRRFVHPRFAQLWYGIAALADEPVSSLLALRTACEPSCDAARERLSAALDLLPSVHASPRSKGESLP